MPQHSQCVQRLCTVADDAADVVRCRQRVGERDAEHFQRSAAGHIRQRRRRLDAVSTSVVVEHDFPCLGLVEPQVVISCPCCYVAKLSNTRISMGGRYHQVRVICILHEAVVGVQRPEVSRSDSVRGWANAGTLNDAG